MYGAMDSLKGLTVTMPQALEGIHTCCDAFRMVKRIGKGSQGNVFLALHIPTMKAYAIKRLRSSTVPSMIIMKNELKTLKKLCRCAEGQDEPTTLTFCQKCINERGFELNDVGKLVMKPTANSPPSPKAGQPLNLTEAFHCPYVVQFIENFPDTGDGSQCFVMEYMRWGSLLDIMATGRVFEECELAIIAYSVLQALQYLAEHNYVHRDVKPANILLDAWGMVKLCDFGTACTTEEQATLGINLKQSLLAGTLHYMSPECFQLNIYTHKSDIWSLGVSIIHLMHNIRPFAQSNSFWGLRDSVTAATLETFMPECVHTHDHSEPLIKFLSKCVVADAAMRYTASELLQMPFITSAVPGHSGDTKHHPMGGHLSSPTSVTATATVTAVCPTVANTKTPANTCSSMDVGGTYSTTSVDSLDHTSAGYASHGYDYQQEEPPRLTALAAELQKDPTHGEFSVLGFIIADERPPGEDISKLLEALSAQLGMQKAALDTLIAANRPINNEFA